MLHPARKLAASIRKRVRRLLWKRPAGEAGAVATRQGLFYLDPQDKGVSEQLRRCGEYELDDLRRIEKLLGPGSGVLVVGAHLGALAVPLSKRCRHLTAVEANPRTFSLLERNLDANACANARCLNVAAAEKDGELDFVFNTFNSGGSKRMPKHKDRDYFFDDPAVGKVKCARLDDILEGWSYDLILMDIEGSEPFALAGMPRLLSKARHLVVEFLPRHLDRAAGVTLDAFLEPILPHFDRLTIPTAGKAVRGRERIAAELRKRFDRRKGDPGLIFSKAG